MTLSSFAQAGEFEYKILGFHRNGFLDVCLPSCHVHDNGMSDIRTEKRKASGTVGAQGGITIGLNYSLADMPGILPVNTLGRGWSPTLYRRAMEPTMIKMSATTVPVINTNVLIRNRRTEQSVSG